VYTLSTWMSDRAQVQFPMPDIYLSM